MRTHIANHSTVAVAELTHLFGALDPANSGTVRVLRAIGQTLDDIPAHRLSTPSARTCGEAGMLAGLVQRLTGQPRTAALPSGAMI